MNNGLVSVIVPIYNVAEYLDACIASIVSQTYRHIEVILVDDGATDESGTKCDAWEKNDPRIKVYHKENGGLSNARNYGLQYAKGEFVYFVDGDDRIKPDLLEKVLPYMDEQTDMVAFGYVMVYPDGKEINVRFDQKSIEFADPTAMVHFLLNDFFQYKIGWSAWNSVFKRKIVETNNIHFVDKKRIFAEDQLFCMSYLSHAKKIVCLDECYYYYLQRDNSIMGNARNNTTSFYYCVEECRAFFEHIKKTQPESEYILYQPVFLYMLLEKRIKKYLRATGFNFLAARQYIIEDVRKGSDISYFMNNTELILEKKKELLSKFHFLKREEIVECSKWLIGKRNHFKLICFLMRMRDRIRGN